MIPEKNLIKIIFRQKHTLNLVISYIQLNLHGENRKYHLESQGNGVRFVKQLGEGLLNFYCGYTSGWVIRISVKWSRRGGIEVGGRGSREGRGETWTHKSSYSILMEEYKLSCSTPLSLMFLLSFSTVKGEGSLQPTFQIPWGFLGKPFSSLDKHHPFSSFQCRSQS